MLTHATDMHTPFQETVANNKIRNNNKKKSSTELTAEAEKA